MLRVFIAIVVTALLAALPYASPLIRGVIHDAQLGDDFAVSGLVLTVGGFGITVWQLIRTREATRQSAEAVRELATRLRAFENANLCSICLAIAGEITRLHSFASSGRSLHTLVFLPERYRSLWVGLVRLREHAAQYFKELDLETIQRAVSKLQNAENNVSRSIARKAAPSHPDLQPLQKAMQPLTEMLTVLSVTLDKNATGVANDQ